MAILVFGVVLAFSSGCATQKHDPPLPPGFSVYTARIIDGKKVDIPLAINPKDYKHVECTKDANGEWVVPPGYCRNMDEVDTINKNSSGKLPLWEVVGGAVVTSLGLVILWGILAAF